MAKKKRESAVLERAKKRLAGLLSIDENLNLGDGISIKSITDAVSALSTANSKYNTLLSNTDKALIDVRALEAGMNDLLDRTLSKVAGKYGRNSTEYAQAGGTRRSDRRKRGEAKKAKEKKKETKLKKLEKLQGASSQAPNGEADSKPSQNEQRTVTNGVNGQAQPQQLQQ